MSLFFEQTTIKLCALFYFLIIYSFVALKRINMEEAPTFTLPDYCSPDTTIPWSEAERRQAAEEEILRHEGAPPKMILIHKDQQPEPEDLDSDDDEEDLNPNTNPHLLDDLGKLARKLEARKKKLAAKASSTVAKKPPKEPKDYKKIKNDDAETVKTTSNNRQKNYTPVEDLLICKAYISASEDPIVGNKTTGALFQGKIGDKYQALADTYIQEEKIKWKLAKRSSKDSAQSEFHPQEFPIRKSKNLLVRFRKIAADVLKFMSIEKQNPATSGENREATQQRHLEIWKERKGTTFPFLHCADYLREKPKWKSILTEDNGTVKSGKTAAAKTVQSIDRPIGKKRATKEKEKEKLVASIATNVLDKFFDGRENKKAKVADETITNEKRQFLAEASGALKLFMQQMMLDGLPTPEKMQMKKEQAKLAMAEMRARSELNIAELKAMRASLDGDESEKENN
jgi:hypothetical protein